MGTIDRLDIIAANIGFGNAASNGAVHVFQSLPNTGHISVLKSGLPGNVDFRVDGSFSATSFNATGISAQTLSATETLTVGNVGAAPFMLISNANRSVDIRGNVAIGNILSLTANDAAVQGGLIVGRGLSTGSPFILLDANVLTNTVTVVGNVIATTLTGTLVSNTNASNITSGIVGLPFGGLGISVPGRTGTGNAVLNVSPTFQGTVVLSNVTGETASFTSNISASGAVLTSNLTAGGGTFSSNIAAAYYIGNGSLLQGIVPVFSNVKTNDGSAAGPAYTFSSRTNAGMYYAGNESLGFATSGVQRASLSALALIVSSNVITSGILNFGDRFANTLISLWGNTLDSTATNVFGVGVNSDTLRYGVSQPTQRHSFYGGTTLFGNVHSGGFHSANLGSANIPSYSFASRANAGMYITQSDVLGLSVRGIEQMTLSPTSATVTQQLTAGDGVLSAGGTSSAPSYAFTTRSNAGMYYAATDTIGFATAGVQRATISATGLAATTFLGNVVGANAVLSGQITASTANILTIGASTLYGNVSGANVSISGQITASTANITNIGASTMYGNLSGANAVLSGQITAATANITHIGASTLFGNLSGANASLSGQITASTANITHIGASTLFGNLSGANAVLSGQITASTANIIHIGASTFFGNVVGANAVMSGQITAATANISTIGASTLFGNVIGATAVLSGQITAATANITTVRASTLFGNVSGANAVLSGQITAATANITHIGASTLSGNLSGANAVLSGQITASTANIISIGASTLFGNLSGANAVLSGQITAATANITHIGASTLFGNLSGANAVLSGQITASTANISNIGASTFFGNVVGANAVMSGQITAATANIISIGASTLFGNVIGANAVLSGQITASTANIGSINASTLFGNLSGANAILSGQITAATANILTVGASTLFGNLSGANAILSGQITAATANVISLGASTIYANLRGANAVLTGQITTSTANFSTLEASTIYYGNLIGANAVLTGSVTGSTANFSNLVAGNITVSTILSGQITGATANFSTVAANVYGNVSGNAVVTGQITGTTANFSSLTASTIYYANLIGTGAGLSGSTANFGTVQATTVYANVIGANVALTGQITSATANIGTVGTTTLFGNVIGSNVVTGQISGATANFSSLTASTIYYANLIGTGAGLSGSTANFETVQATTLFGNVIGANAALTGQITATTANFIHVTSGTANVSTLGASTLFGNVRGDNVFVTGQITASTANITHLTSTSIAGNTASFSGNIDAKYLYGNGIFLEGVVVSASNASNISSGLIALQFGGTGRNTPGTTGTGNLVFDTNPTFRGSATVDGDLTANMVYGNIDGTIAFDDELVFENIAAGNVVVSGNVTANSISGNLYGALIFNEAETFEFGGLRANRGTAAEPSYAFAPDTDTGIFSPASNQWAVSAGGSQRVLVDSTGLNVSGNIVGNYLLGNGAFLSGIVASGGGGGGSSNASDISSGILALEYGGTGANTPGTTGTGNLVFDTSPTFRGNVTVGNIAANNAVFASNVTGAYLFGNGAFLSGIVTSGGGGSSNASDISSGILALEYGGTGANTSGVTGTGNLVFDTSPTFRGNVTVGNVAGNNAIFASNVSGAYLFGNGAFLSGIVTSGGGTSNASNISSGILPLQYGGTGANVPGITGTGNLVFDTNPTFRGDAVVYANLAAANAVIQTLTANTLNANITGNLVFLNDSFDVGNVYAIRGTAAAPSYSFAPDTNTGAFSPGSDQWAVATGGTQRLLVNANGLSVSGNVSAPYFTGNGSQLTGIVTSGGMNQGDGFALSNINAANLVGTLSDERDFLLVMSGGVDGSFAVADTLTANDAAFVSNVSANYFLGNGAFLTGVVASSSANDGDGYALSNINAANIVGILSTDLTLMSGGVDGSFAVADTLTANNAAFASNVSVGGALAVTSNVSGEYFIGNGAFLTGIVASSSANDGNGYALGNINAANIVGILTTDLTLMSGGVDGSFAVADTLTANNAAFASNVTANYFLGNGAYLTGIVTSESVTITSVSVTDIDGVALDDTALGESSYLTIFGTSFGAGCVAMLGAVSASATTGISSTQLRARFTGLAAGTYSLFVINTDGTSAVLASAVTWSLSPVWSGTGTLDATTKTRSFSRTLALANGDSTLTYALASGSTLPPGTTLLGNGSLSGNITETQSASTSYSFTVKATDLQLQDVPKTFALNAGFFKLFSGNANVVVSNATYTGDTNHLAVSNSGGFVKIVADAPAFAANAIANLGNVTLSSTFISATELRAVVPAAAEGTISPLEIVNADGSVLTNANIAQWAPPAWTTASGQLGTAIFKGDAFSRTVVATHGAGNVTYTAISGFPAGVTVNSSGIVSGSTPGGNTDEIVTIVLNAIAVNTLQNATREFTLSLFGDKYGSLSTTILTSSTLKLAAKSLFSPTTLRFRASIHGFTAAAFHQYCNNYAPIFFVIKANTGYIATAYTSVAFNSGPGYKNAGTNGAWLNNLWNGTVTSTTKYYNTIYPGQSIYDFSSYGPTFGGGHDMYIGDNFNTTTGYTNPNSYTLPTNSTLFGNYNSWTVTELEAYT